MWRSALVYRLTSFRERFPLTISHTIRPNDWHQVSLSLSLSFSVFAVRYSIRRKAFCIPTSSVDQKSSCKSRRAGRDELPSGEHAANSRTHTVTQEHTFACGTRTYVLIPRIPWPLSIERVFHVFFLLLSKRHLFHATLALERREGAARGIHLIDRFTASEDIPSPHYLWHVFSRAAFPPGPLCPGTCLCSKVNLSSMLGIARLTTRTA